MSDADAAPFSPNPAHPVQIALRIPGQWSGPRELFDALPRGVRVDGDDRLVLPGGPSVQFTVLEADDEFPSLFAQSCTREPSERDKAVVQAYTANFCIAGPGGSDAAARAMVHAAAALCRAGGAGVFVDNSGLAHGSDDWLDIADAESDDGMYWAYVTTVGDPRDVFSVGMHVFGLPDAVVPRSGDDRFDHFYLNNFLGYTWRSGRPMHDGDVVGDPSSMHFKVRREPPDPRSLPGHPMHNPFGRWRLEPYDAADN